MRALSLLVAAALVGGCASFDEASSADASDARVDRSVADVASPRDDRSAPPPSSDGGRPDASPRHDATEQDGGHADAARGDGSVTVRDSATPPVDAPSPAPDGGVETVMSGLLQASFLTVDSSNVYVSDEGTATGSVIQAPKQGGGASIVLGPGEASGIAVLEGRVYWTDFTGSQLYSCVIGGCSGKPELVLGGQTEAQAMGTDGTHFFWFSGGDVQTSTFPLVTNLETVASNQAGVMEIASSGSTLFWLSGESLYACAPDGCGGSPFKVTSAVGGSVAFANDAVYFDDQAMVLSCPAAATACTPTPIGATFAPVGVAADSSYVYWLDQEETGVFRCPLTGCPGQAELFASSPMASPGATVALDDDYVYWTATTTVLRQHK